MPLQSDKHCLTARKPWEKLACLLLIAASLLYYWSVFFYYALDAGQADEFVDVLWFFEIFREQVNWLDKLAVIALPNHEHVTIFNHLVYLADYALFKQINFFHYTMIGHFIVLACCLLIADWLKKTVGWWYALALAFGLFLNLFYWHASFWSMTALSNQAVILFALLAARSFSRNPSAIVMPMFWALLAVTTQFNGLLVLPALVASGFFSARSENRQQNWRQLLMWFGVFIVVVAIYIGYEDPFAADHLWRYVNYTDPNNLADYIKPTHGQSISKIKAILNAVLMMLSACGATAFNLDNSVLAVIVGIVMLLALLYLALNKNETLPDRFWWMLLFFTLASLSLVAIGRGFIFGVEAGLQYRYRLYSFLLIALIAGGFLQRKNSIYFMRSLLLACLVMQIFSLHVLDDIGVERENIKISYYNWLVDGGMGRSKMPFYPHNQDLRLFNAYEREYYNPYNAIDSRHKPVSIAVMKDGACGVSVLDSSEADTVQVWSKKYRALAVEIKLNIEPSARFAKLWFCDSAVSYLVVLDKHNINKATGKYWPLLVLKKQLPPSQYRVILQNIDGSYKLLGDIAFP